MPSHASPPRPPPASFMRTPKPLSPVESLEQSSSYMSLALEDGFQEIRSLAKRPREGRLFEPLWDALSSFSPSSWDSSPSSSPLKWFQKRQKLDDAEESASKYPRDSRGAQVERIPGFVRSSPLREAQAPESRSNDLKPHSFDAFRDLDVYCQSSHAFSRYGRLRGPPNPLHDPPQYLKRIAKSNGCEELTSMFGRNNRARGPFRPSQRSAGKGTPSWQLRQFAEATLGSGSLRKAVKLPEGEDENEWLAVNVVDFYNQINLLYGSITEFCSPTSCPEMKATDEYEYLWQDPNASQFKRPTKMSAPEYVEHLMSWCQSNIDNESIFPAKLGVNFPKQFRPVVQQMFKRLYRVYAHIYCHHYAVVMQLGLEPHLNTSFKHYVLFVDEHGLAGMTEGKKTEFWGPLSELVENMLKVD